MTTKKGKPDMPTMRRTHTAADLGNHTPDEWHALIANVQRSISHGRRMTAQAPTGAIYATATGDRPAQAQHVRDHDPDWVFVDSTKDTPEGTAEKHTPAPSKSRQPEATPEAHTEDDGDWVFVHGEGGTG